MSWVWTITGWVLLLFAVKLVGDGLSSSFVAARTGDSISRGTLFSFPVIFAAVVVMLSNDSVDKNHLLWIIPLTWLVGGTIVGRWIGGFIGYVVYFLWAPKSR